MTPTKHVVTMQTVLPGIGQSLDEKVEQAIELLRLYEPSALKLSPNGYYLGFSGGKDSCVIKELARLSGVKHECWYSQTTIDPPELVRFIKQVHPDVKWNRPKRNFFKALADSHGLPSRLVRWCCAEFKENTPSDFVKIFGVRAAESVNRKKSWKLVNMRNNGPAVAPILFWSDADVWDFIRTRKVSYCSLYDEGFTRLGCVGCPMAGKQRRIEFARWPGFERAWRNAAIKYCALRKGKLKANGEPYYTDRFVDGNEYFNWWLSDNPSAEDDPGQQCLDLS